jgi:high-affinity Fe2+/Pb2+ permease|tara:strand:- start:190 stop:444 length:255 start_codon:yes stop_codon:yes gene_type:complete
MGVDKNTFRYRLSNVIAWIGLLGGVTFSGFIAFAFLVLIVGNSIAGAEDFLIPSLGVLATCALINYLMVGSVRLLPWRDIEDQE